MGFRTTQGNFARSVRRTLPSGRSMHRRPVTFEIARQLQAPGQKVGRLVLFDTPAPVNLNSDEWHPCAIDRSATQLDLNDGNLLQPS